MYIMMIRLTTQGLFAGYVPACDPIPDDVVIIIGECKSAAVAEGICRSAEVRQLSRAILAVLGIAYPHDDSPYRNYRPSIN